MPILSRLKLPLAFDPQALESDLNRILDNEWVRHFNDRYYEGEWSGVALRSSKGSSGQLYSDPVSDELPTDTPVLARCPAFLRVLAQFECPVKSARLLKLGAGARILEHRDYNLSLDDGEVRLHIAITTNPLVDFYLNGDRIVMNPGECWYINANLPHKVENKSETPRVHMVIDCKVDDWLRSLAASAAAELGLTPDSIANKKRPSSREAFERFCNAVVDNGALQERLREVRDKEMFIDLVVRVGEESGHIFNADDVREEYRAKRRAWVERWI